MAKKKKAKSEAAKAVKEPRLLESTLTQVEALYTKCEKRFTQALEESERRTITLTFNVTLDLSEAAPVVDASLSFKDKCKESGFDVVKTFKAKSSVELDDPNQPKLPGVEDEEPSGKEAASNPD